MTAPPPPDVLGHMVHDLPYPVWYAAADGRREYFNAQWEALTGRDRDTDRGWNWLENVHPGDRPVWELIWQEANRQVRPYKARYRVGGASGGWYWLTERAQPLQGGESWFGTCEVDPGGGDGREAEIRRLRRIYEAISQTNQAIVKLRDRRALLRRLCEIAVDLGGFDTAWIAWRDADGSIAPTAWAGGLEENLERLTEISTGVQSDAADPVARLFATDRRVIVGIDDLAANSAWRPICSSAGIRAVGAFPLREYGHLVGGFILHTQDPDAFDAQALSLLDEMAGDISFSLDIFMADKERRDAERELRRTRDRLSAVVTAAPLPIVALDRERRVQLWNPAAERVFAWRREQVVGSEMPLRSTNGDGLGQSLQSLFTGNPVRDVEDQVRTRDGKTVPVRIAGAPTTDGRGTVTGLMAVLEDVSGEREAARRERFAHAVFEHSPDGIVVTDDAFRVLQANPAFERMCGRAAASMVGELLPLLAWRTDGDASVEELSAQLHETGYWQGELTYRRAGGTEVPTWLSMSRLPPNGYQQPRFVALIADISELKAAERHIEHLALHDPLTGLPNRTLLEERVDAAVAEALAEGGQGALLFMDLDRFKLINDSLGHAVGDRLLCAVVERLRRILPEEATFSRLGGDEFIVLLPRIDGTRDAEDLARRIAAAFKAPFDVDEQSLTIRSTIGMVALPEAGQGLDALLRKADAAMYAAKRQGRGQAQWFTREMNARAIERYQMEAALRGARERQELSLALQPQFSLADGRVMAFEALLRWDHPEYGPVDPTRFVPLAEESGEIVPLGEWALSQACAINRRLHAAGLAAVPVAVNVSAAQLHHPGIVDSVRQAVEQAGLDPAWLELELTETMLLGRDAELGDTLERLRAFGVRLAIDDFGTGYSSMNYLKQYPIDKLKIDRTFVSDVHVDADSAAIVRAILGMAHSLGITVVAEGVESREEAALLAAEGCEGVQGFLYASPMPESELYGNLPDQDASGRRQCGSRGD